MSSAGAPYITYNAREQDYKIEQTCVLMDIRSTILARLTYASRAWSGFCSADDIKKLDSFINKSKKSDYCNPKSPSVKQLFAEPDTSLFKSVFAVRCYA